MAAKRMTVTVSLTPKQVELLGMMACGGVLAHEKSRTERTLWLAFDRALREAKKAGAT